MGSKKQAKKSVAKKSTSRRGRGRPTDYRPEYVELAYNYALLGATDAEMSGFFGVCEMTLNRWKLAHPEFCESIKSGKDEADANVAKRLYQRAIGYDAPDVKFATFEGKITDSKEFIKHHAPDVTAAIFWLKNRQPSKWRDKKEVGLTDDEGVIAEIVTRAKVVSPLIDQRLEAAKEALAKKKEQSSELEGSDEAVDG